MKHPNMSLKLVIIEEFHDIPCHIYKDICNHFFLIETEIGQVLEYVNPNKSIRELHKNHQNQLNALSINIETPSKEKIRYYSERGIIEICKWSRKPKTTLFLNWFLDMIQNYQQKEIQDLDSISYFNELQHTITVLTKNVSSLQQDICNIEQTISGMNQSNQKSSYTHSHTNWQKRMLLKYKILRDYFQISQKQLLHKLYLLLESIQPDIQISELQEQYCQDHDLVSCFPTEAIEYNENARNAFEDIVNHILETYHLQNQMIHSVFS